MTDKNGLIGPENFDAWLRWVHRLAKRKEPAPEPGDKRTPEEPWCTESRERGLKRAHQTTHWRKRRCAKTG